MKLGTGGRIAIGAGIAVVVGAAIGGIAYMISRAAPPTVYHCPYCGATFDTYEDLVAHIQNEHPGEEVPPPTSKFSYTNLRCSSPWDPTSDHCLLDVECDITNVGGAPATRTINLWLFLEEPYGWSVVDSFQLTLQPGETYHYHFTGGYYLPIPGYANVMYVEVADETCLPTERTDVPCIGGDHSSICTCYMGYG